MVKKLSIKQRIKNRQAAENLVKARIARAIPFFAGREDTAYVWGNRSTWEVELHFKTASQAKRFCDHANELGHSAKMRQKIRWSRAYGGSTDGYHATSKEVILKMDPKKKTPAKPVPLFDPKSVKLDLVPGKLTKKVVTEAIEKFPVGEKVLASFRGEDVDDAIHHGGVCGRKDEVIVTPDSIVFHCPFGLVTMVHDEGSWHLSWNGTNPVSEACKPTNVALWKALCTAWNYGIRGVI